MSLDKSQIKFWLSSNNYKYQLKHNNGTLISQLETPNSLNEKNFAYTQFDDFEHPEQQNILTNLNKQKTPKKINYKTDHFLNYDTNFLDNLSNGIKYFEGIPDWAVYQDVIYLPAYKSLYLLNEDKVISLELNRKLRNIAPEEQRRINTKVKKFAQKSLNKIQKIKNPLIYGGEIFINHYGHFLTEAFSRLWYSLSLEQQDYPILVDIPSPSQIRSKKTYLDIFYENLSLDSNRYISLLQPVFLKQLIVPGQTMGLAKNGGYEVHKLIPENVAAKLINKNRKTTSQPLYLSRTRLQKSASNRNIFNEIELENQLREAGCAIVYPETKTLTEQINLINQHETIIAISGSALHNVLFDLSNNKKVICLSGKKHINRALVYIDEMKNIESFYIGCLDSQTLDLDTTIDCLKSLGIVSASKTPRVYREVLTESTVYS